MDDVAACPTEPATIPGPGDAGASPSEALGGLDLETARRVWGDNEEGFRHFLRKFTATYGGVVRELSGSIARGDLESASRIGHKLAGSAGTMALPDVARLARQIERTCAEGREPDTLVEDLGEALETALASIARFLAESAGPGPDAG
jgi:HPt (histidine-containing phosphotransfer) domain-containing protein